MFGGVDEIALWSFEDGSFIVEAFVRRSNGDVWFFVSGKGATYPE